MSSIKLNEQGKQRVEKARIMQGYSLADWADRTDMAESTLKRFLKGEPVRADNFKTLCESVGLDDWQELVAWDTKDSTRVVSPSEVEALLASSEQATEPNTLAPEERKYGISISAVLSESKRLKAMALFEQLKNVLSDVDVIITQG